VLSYLNGKILNKNKGFVILLVGGVGYKVFVSEAMYADLSAGAEAEIYTHQHVREDALDLFGFKNMEELEMFELLLSVSGIGPRSALSVLSIADAAEIKESITSGDPALLIKVSGIGKKTAERVVLELRDKVAHLTPVKGTGQSGLFAGGDEIDALISLGYSLQQAREALGKVDKKIKGPGARIKEALKIIK